VRDEVCGDRVVPRQDRRLVGRAPVAESRRRDVRTVLDQQPHAVHEAPARRRPELLDEQALRRVQFIGKARVPRTSRLASEAELEEQAQVAVVFPEVAVVEHLPVVRIGARLEQEAREPVTLRMRRLARAALALAVGARQRREGGHVAAPEEARVGISAALEQQPRRRERRTRAVRAREPGVARVEKRRPAVRSRLRIRRARVAIERRAERGSVPRSGGRGNARR
jgi:hypothetical protein